MSKHNNLLIVGVVLAVLVVLYFVMSDSKPKEKFYYKQILDDAPTYTFTPPPIESTRADFGAMVCNPLLNTGAGPLKGMTSDQIKKEVDLYYKKPMEMVEPKDLLPEPSLSGLNAGVDPADDFSNKFVWHRTTHAQLQKRRNWETGAAMIRGDLIIDPGHQSWFQHTNNYQDLTAGFIPKQYCGQINVEDLVYDAAK